jgi:hypothetical protein
MRSTQEFLLEIARRKERLSARAQAQRQALAGTVHDLRQPMAVADRALSIARFLRAHPVFVAAVVTAAVAALVAFRGRGLAGLAGRALSAWRLWRMVSSAWSAGRSA